MLAPESNQDDDDFALNSALSQLQIQDKQDIELLYNDLSIKPLPPNDCYSLSDGTSLSLISHYRVTLQQYESRVHELERENQHLIQQNKQLLQQNDILGRNLSCLFKTATLELQRREKQWQQQQQRPTRAKSVTPVRSMNTPTKRTEDDQTTPKPSRTKPPLAPSLNSI